ncbi:hypothetical protein ACFRJ3_29625 [Streptomyces sp. NPDC056696]|uniref:hypothetical protein n=1 Tax=Streptomyces sp. NPDC056696 TaxID=3345914 RepID=UPI0036B3FB33
MRQELPAYIRKYLWGLRFWSPSHFAASCGGAPTASNTSRTGNVPADANSADPCPSPGQSSPEKRFLPGVNARGSSLEHAESRSSGSA